MGTMSYQLKIVSPELNGICRVSQGINFIIDCCNKYFYSFQLPSIFLGITFDIQGETYDFLLLLRDILSIHST